MELLLSSPEMIRPLWPFIEHFALELAGLSNGKFVPDDMYQSIAKGDWQLWLAYDGTVRAIMTTRFWYYPRMKVVEIIGLAGNGMEDFVPQLLPRFEDWAHEQGAVQMVSLGRPGWERVLKHHGYQRTRVQMEKSL